MELKVKILDIETGKYVVLMNDEDARDLGIHASDRVDISADSGAITSMINITESSILEGGIGIFDEVKRALGLKEGDVVKVSSARRPKSIEYIRKKVDGFKLNDYEIKTIIRDIVDNNLSDIELSGFITASYIHPADTNETIAMIRAMVETGEQMDFGGGVIDKHSIGGVAGNRTTMLLVPIIASSGLIMPKTSSRAITSASGTSDTMEVLANVTFDIEEIKRIVNRTNGCMVWGGAVNLAPADDKIIRVEYPLSIDPDSQMLASVLAKKKSVGAKNLIIDIPVGKGSKISNEERGNELARKFIEFGSKLDIKVRCLVTDGSSPIGYGIGPALEAIDVLIALDNKKFDEKRVPWDLINKSLDMAGAAFELADTKLTKGDGRAVAEKILFSGRAMKKMRQIIEAQGGNPEISADDIEVGDKTHVITSDRKGKVRFISNWRIAQVARAAGAPKNKQAGVYLGVGVGDSVKAGDPLFTIYSKSENKLEQAIALSAALKPVQVGGVIIGEVF